MTGICVMGGRGLRFPDPCFTTCPLSWDPSGLLCRGTVSLLLSPGTATHRGPPQAAHIVVPLEAGGLQPLLQAAADGGQAADAGPHDGRTLPRVAGRSVCGQLLQQRVPQNLGLLRGPAAGPSPQHRETQMHINTSSRFYHPGSSETLGLVSPRFLRVPRGSELGREGP